MAGVALSAPQARFAWQAWYFLYHHRCQQKLGDEVGLMWRRGLLRGRRAAFGTPDAICVAGVVLSVPPYRCQRRLGDEVGLMWRRGLLRGRRGAFGTSGSICVAGAVQMWRRGLLRGRRGTFGTSGSICVAGVVLSVPP